MSESNPPPSSSKIRDWFSLNADALGIVGGIVTIVTLVPTIANWLPWPWFLIPFTVGGTLLSVGIVARVSLVNDEPLQTIDYIRASVLVTDESIASSRAERPEERLSDFTLEEFERRFGDRYQLVELKPNLMARLEVERVPVYVDKHGVIVAGAPSNGAETSFAHVLAISNRSNKGRVASVNGVAVRLAYDDFENGFVSIERGHWLSEKAIDVDFRPNGSPHRVVLALENSANQIFAVRRDFETAHTGPKAMLEPLQKDLYRINLTLLETSGPYKRNLKYILKVEHDPKLKIEIPTEYVWLSHHLNVFYTRGHDLIMKGYDISRDAHEKFMSEQFPEIALSQIRAQEDKQRVDLAESAKAWIQTTSDFLRLAYGQEKSDRFFNAVPTVEQGLQRAAKTWRHLVMPAMLAGIKGEQPASETRTWDLTESLKVRLDQLSVFSKTTSSLGDGFFYK